MIRFRTAAVGGLLLSLLLNACSSGAGGTLPTAPPTGNMHSLIGGTTPQRTGTFPVSANCPSIVTPGASRIGVHTQPTQRLGGALSSDGATLPARSGCGNGIAGPKRTMAWSGCSSGQQDFGCNAHQSPGDGMVWVPGGCAWLAGYQGQESCTPGYWESGCAAMGLPNNCGGGGSGYIPGASPCVTVSLCKQIAYQGPATPGKPCTRGGASSDPIGTAPQGKDIPGPTGNEINQVYYINLNSGSGVKSQSCCKFGSVAA